MNRCIYIISAVLAVFTFNSSSADKVIFQSKFKKLKPGEELFKFIDAARKRQELFPDSKPSNEIVLMPRENHFTGSLTAVGTKDGELKIIPVQDKKYPLRRTGEILLPLKDAGSNITVELSLKTENFLKRKAKNYFFIYIGGVHIWLRGDSKDLRCYNVDKKSYQRVIRLENNKKYNLKINLRFEKKPVFDLTIDDKEIFKAELQRGGTHGLKLVKMTFSFELRNKTNPIPAISLNSLKIVNNQ